MHAHQSAQFQELAFEEMQTRWQGRASLPTCAGRIYSYRWMYLNNEPSANHARKMFDAQMRIRIQERSPLWHVFARVHEIEMGKSSYMYRVRSFSLMGVL